MASYFDILSSNGLDPIRLQWVWSVSYQDVGLYTVEEYWVGENYTHWLGIDGYNYGLTQSWSKWEWPNEVFDNMMGRLRKLSPTKPISINEYGTSKYYRLDKTKYSKYEEGYSKSIHMSLSLTFLSSKNVIIPRRRGVISRNCVITMCHTFLFFLLVILPDSSV